MKTAISSLMVCVAISCASPTTGFVFTELRVRAIDEEGVALAGAAVVVTYTVPELTAAIPGFSNDAMGNRWVAPRTGDFTFFSRTGPDGIALIHMPGIWYRYLRWRGLGKNLTPQNPPLPTLRVRTASTSDGPAASQYGMSSLLPGCDFPGAHEETGATADWMNARLDIEGDASGYGHEVRIYLTCVVGKRSPESQGRAQLPAFAR